MLLLLLMLLPLPMLLLHPEFIYMHAATLAFDR
jgi:hypothetical protein